MPNEFRCILTNREAMEILAKAKIISSFHIIDEYTGAQRIRTANFSEVIEKEYPTSVTGKAARIGFKIDWPGIEGPTYLELKITDKQFCRWEIEFEGEVPEEFKDRENIHGWQILAD